MAPDPDTRDQLVAGIRRFVDEKLIPREPWSPKPPPFLRCGADQHAQRLDRFAAGADYSALADCDLVIEAVFEDLAAPVPICPTP